MKTAPSNNLTLHRRSEGYLPFFVEDYEVTKIHFFDENGVRWTIEKGWFDLIETENGLTRVLNPLAYLNLFTPYVKKRKPDFTLPYAFFIPVQGRDNISKKHAELYLPIKAYKWEERKNAIYHQWEDKQIVFDVYILKRSLLPVPDGDIGICIEVQSGERPITRKMAEEQMAEDYLAIFEEPLKSIIGNFVTSKRRYNETKESLEKQKATIEEALKNLNSPFWIDDVVKPIAEALLKEPELAGYHYVIYGPFGIPANTSIYFKTDDKSKPTLSLHFSPTSLEIGEISLRDYTVNTHEFRDGTIGEMNDMNHPLMPMKTSIRGLVTLMFEELAKDIKQTSQAQ